MLFNKNCYYKIVYKKAFKSQLNIKDFWECYGFNKENWFPGLF